MMASGFFFVVISAQGEVHADGLAGFQDTLAIHRQLHGFPPAPE